jgi:hypothetical protein
MTVWIYVDTSKEVGDVDHLKVFANEENDPEGVAFEYEVLELAHDPASVRPSGAVNRCLA